MQEHFYVGDIESAAALVMHGHRLSHAIPFENRLRFFFDPDNRLADTYLCYRAYRLLVDARTFAKTMEEITEEIAQEMAKSEECPS